MYIALTVLVYLGTNLEVSDLSSSPVRGNGHSSIAQAFPTYGDYLNFSRPSVPKTAFSLYASSPRQGSVRTPSADNIRKPLLQQKRKQYFQRKCVFLMRFVEI